MGKDNCLITKLVYVHEGIEKEAPQSKRNQLKNPCYFCDTGKGKENIEFWKEIGEYIENQYEVEKIKKIYVNADGGSWIKSGMKELGKTVHVLDGFHLEKYIRKLTKNLKENREERRETLKKWIKEGKRKEFKKEMERMREEVGEEGAKKIEEAGKYILNNWEASRLRMRKDEEIEKSSTEGHVSHVLSSRMSSRPMGWSKKGAQNMAKLRAYYMNGKKEERYERMLELVRMQERELPKAAGSEYEILTAKDSILSEKNKHGELGKRMECITYSISESGKKQLYFNSHIWML